MFISTRSKSSRLTMLKYGTNNSAWNIVCLIDKHSKLILNWFENFLLIAIFKWKQLSQAFASIACLCAFMVCLFILLFSSFIFEKHKIPSNKYRRKVDNTNLLTLTIDRAKNRDRQSDFQVIPLHSTEQKN